MYNVLADEEELKWFYDNIIQRPQINESYSMVFVCRHKKLTDEEKARMGLTRSKGEFLNTQSIRLRTISGKNACNLTWDFANFLQHVKRFNVDDGAYLTESGERLPDKTLAVIFYVNPCDDMKVAERLQEQLNETKMAIMKAYLGGKDINTSFTNYRLFGNIESNVKHLKANCKGSNYWLDYDIDVPAWWKERVDHFNLRSSQFLNKVFGDKIDRIGFYDQMAAVFDKYYGKGNYVVINTTGGYHVLVRSVCVRFDPHKVCTEIENIYKKALENGLEPYVNDKGEDKFECIVNDSQIPGIPLPGTFQYGNKVYVVNKDDFKTKE